MSHYYSTEPCCCVWQHKLLDLGFESCSRHGCTCIFRRLSVTLLLCPGCATSQSRSHITTDSLSASPPWCQARSGTRDQFFFLLEISFRQLRVCYFVAPSLTRGRVCNLLLLLVLASAVPLEPALSDERSGLSFVSLLSVAVYSQSVCT
jgi:hypothetical protein